MGGSRSPALIERATVELQSWLSDSRLALSLAEGVLEHLSDDPWLAADSAGQLEGLLSDVPEASASLVGLLRELLQYLPPKPE